MFFCVYLVLLALALVTFFVKRRYTYWQRNGFPYDKDTKIPFGCLESVSKHEKSMGMAIHDVYLKTKERYFGIYLLFRPAILVRDVTLVRHVLAQDFGSFHDRGIYVDEKKDPLSANLFSLRGQSWRTMRTKLAPSFTSGKLKAMFGTVDDIGNKMVQHINTKLPTEGSAEVDLKEICTTYAVDIIGSVIFGLEIDSFKNPNNKFRQIVTRTRRNTFFSAVFGMLIFLVPDVAKFFFKLGFKNQVVLSILSIIKDTVAQREKENIVRKDLLQLLIQLRNSGEINEDDANWEFKTSAETKKSLSFEEMAANAFIFYIAGQETTASTASFTIFELAQYPELLQKAQEEVQTVLRENNNEYSYDSLKKMEFLEQCIKETIRKYPGLPILNRECTQDYRIPGTEHVIKKGTPIVIPLFGIHRDAAYFPNPDVYDPYRFSPENRDKFNQNAYMPFGEGPRHCIAQRMGVLNSKLAVAKILQNFNIEIMPRREIEIDNHAIALIPKGGVKVRLSKCKE